MLNNDVFRGSRNWKNLTTGTLEDADFCFSLLPQTNLTTQAYELAREGHSSQLRKNSDSPYIIHPTAAALGCHEWFLANETILYEWEPTHYIHSQEIIISSLLLHDVWEDTKVPVAAIHDLNEKVFYNVWWLTSADKAASERIEEYYSGNGLNRAKRKRWCLVHTLAAPWEVHVMKLFDRWHNLLCADPKDGFWWGPDSTYLNETDALLEGIYRRRRGSVIGVQIIVSNGEDPLTKLVHEVQARVTEMRKGPPPPCV